jgi:hypothetical protein
MRKPLELSPRPRRKTACCTPFHWYFNRLRRMRCREIRERLSTLKGEGSIDRAAVATELVDHYSVPEKVIFALVTIEPDAARIGYL